MARLLKFIDDKLLFWGIAFLLFFIPLYPKFPLFSVPDTYVSIRLEDIFIAVLVGIFWLKLLLTRDFSIFNWRLTKYVILYFAIGLLSVASGIFITKNIVPHLALLHFLRRVEYLSLLFVAYFSFKETKQLKTYGKIILIATFGVIFYGLGQKFFGWPVVSTMNKEFSKGLILQLTWWARVNSTFAGHYDLAAYMVMVLCLVLAALMVVRKWAWRIFVILLGVFSYYILILTASRVSFGAYLLGGLIVLLLGGKKWWIAPFLALSILGMVFSDDLGQRYAATFKIDLSFMSGLVKMRPPEIAMGPTATPEPTVTPEAEAPGVFIPGQPRATLTPTPTPTPFLSEEATPAAYFEPTALAVGRSTDIRLKVEWPRAARAFAKNPLLGTGYSSITLATDNDYLRMLGETGLLGLAAFFLIILEIIRRFFVTVFSRTTGRVEKGIVLGAIGLGVGYFLNATFIDVFEASKIAFFFWIVMGVVLKVCDLENNRIKDQKIQ